MDASKLLWKGVEKRIQKSEMPLWAVCNYQIVSKVCIWGSDKSLCIWTLLINIFFYVKGQMIKWRQFSGRGAVSSCWDIKGSVWSDTNISCPVALMWKVHARYATVISLCQEQLDIYHSYFLFVCLLLQKSITMSLVQNSLGKLLLLSCCGGCRI